MGILKWVVVGVLCATPAMAAEKIVAEKIGAPQAPKAGAKTVAPEQPMPVETQTQLLCEAYRIMSSYADPSYKEGVDAYGRPVVPADGGADARAFAIPQEIQIPVSVDLAQFLKLPKGIEANRGEVGMISVKSDGRVLYNGTDTTNQLSTVCKATVVQEENIIPGGKVR